MKLPRHDIMLLMVVLIWGANFGVVKTALTEIEPIAFSALRLILGTPAMLLILFLFEKRLLLETGGLVKTRSDIIIFIALSVFLTGDFVFFVKGLAYTTSANASILYSASPILIAALSIMRGTGLNRTGVMGLALAFGGVLMVIGAPKDFSVSAFATSETIRGDALIFIGVVSWAFFTHLSTLVLDRYSAIRVTTYAMVGAAILSTGFSLGPILGQSWLSVSPQGWAGLMYATGLSTVLCLAIWYYAVSKIGPLKVVAFQYLVPVTAIVLAFVLWKEAIYPTQVIGGLLVLAGVRFVRVS